VHKQQRADKWLMCLELPKLLPPWWATHSNDGNSVPWKQRKIRPAREFPSSADDHVGRTEDADGCVEHGGVAGPTPPLTRCQGPSFRPPDRGAAAP
jgi:hypothetical protein